MLRMFILNPLVAFMLLAGASASSSAAAPRLRAVQADLDYVYDVDPAQTERNIELFVERIAAINPDVVFLQAFADPKGTGVASETYFPNRHLALRADLFARVVGELKRRTPVKVFGWLPVLSFELGDKAMLVQAWSPATNTVEPDHQAPRRISPFDSSATARIADIYEDMAMAAPIDGILFHDDAMLSDFEDASPPALAAYARAGLPASIEALRADAATLKAWTAFKTDTLIAFTKNLAAHVRRHRPAIETARNIFAPLVLDTGNDAWFAQNYDKFLQAYDYTAVEAMPRLEKVSDDDAADWLTKLVDASAEHNHGLQRTIFEMQTVDWNLAAAGKERAIPAAILGEQMRLMADEGALNLGYYPDDFVTDTPKLDVLRQDFSLPTDQ